MAEGTGERAGTRAHGQRAHSHDRTRLRGRGRCSGPPRRGADRDRHDPHIAPRGLRKPARDLSGSRRTREGFERLHARLQPGAVDDTVDRLAPLVPVPEPARYPSPALHPSRRTRAALRGLARRGLCNRGRGEPRLLRRGLGLRPGLRLLRRLQRTRARRRHVSRGDRPGARLSRRTPRRARVPVLALLRPALRVHRARRLWLSGSAPRLRGARSLRHDVPKAQAHGEAPERGRRGRDRAHLRLRGRVHGLCDRAAARTSPVRRALRRCGHRGDG